VTTYRELRDSVDTWPSLRVSVQLCPWAWRFKPWLYKDWDSMGLSASFHWLGLEVAFGFNRPPFLIDKG
jgi:hypothetical protein